jgi:hypothetical protein
LACPARLVSGSTLIACLLALSSRAEAGKPAPIITPIAPTEWHVIGASGSGVGPATCTIGAAGRGFFSVDYILPPNDRYYTLLRCATCPAPDSTFFQDVHVALRFTDPCDQPIEISVVAAAGDTACRTPDTLTTILEPEAFVLNSGTLGGFDEFVLHLSRPARFLGDAFLCVNFVRDNLDCASRPELLTEASCRLCRSWNISVAGQQDLCAVAFPGSPVMFANAASCVVPVRMHSWGSLKLRYR